jgi:hypothetical protein
MTKADQKAYLALPHELLHAMGIELSIKVHNGKFAYYLINHSPGGRDYWCDCIHSIDNEIRLLIHDRFIDESTHHDMVKYLTQKFLG